MHSQDFRNFVQVFTSSYDVEAHRNAILALLDPLDLDIEFNKLYGSNNVLKVRSIFTSFADAEEDVYVPDEEQFRLEQIGKLTDEYFEKKEYHLFAQMIYQVLLETLFENYDFGVDTISDLDSAILYAVIPEDIQLQTLLLESMAHSDIFNWSRGDEIIEQSLIVLTVCFSDVYSFLSEDDYEMLSD